MGQLFLISLASVGVLSLSFVCGAKSGLTVGPLEIERDGAKAIEILLAQIRQIALVYMKGGSWYS